MLLCNLKYSLPNKISIIFHNGPTYYYHFIIKELAEEFKKQFTCFGENTEKHMALTVPTEKEVTRIDKNALKSTKIYLTYYNLLIARFMTSSSSNLVNNLSEGIHKIKCKYRHDNEKCKTCRLKYKYCDCFLEHKSFEDNLREYKCLCCNKYYQQKFDKKLKSDFLVYTNFLTTTIISLFYFFEKVFILANIWMIGKNSMKTYNLKKKLFRIT